MSLGFLSPAHALIKIAGDSMIRIHGIRYDYYLKLHNDKKKLKKIGRFGPNLN